MKPIRDGSPLPRWSPPGHLAETVTADPVYLMGRSTEALSEAALVLRRPDFAVAAKTEADGLWARFLLAGQVASTVAPNGTASWFPQIAYGVGSIVEGYLALADATGDSRYAILAGLTASWLTGSNAYPVFVGMIEYVPSGRLSNK